MGLALVPQCLVLDDIALGTVSAPLDDGYVDTLGYYLCYPEARAHVGPLEKFRQWLLGECATGVNGVGQAASPNPLDCTVHLK